MTEFTKPPTSGDQKDMLLAFNNVQRQTLLWKLEGLPEDQLRLKHQPSGISLLGLLKHLVRVEQTWFQARLMGKEPDGSPNDEAAWNPAEDETFEVLKQQYQHACTQSNEIANALPLEQKTIGHAGSYGEVTLQWILFHMLEETSRHLGHADLIREAIDGSIGVNPDHLSRSKGARTLKKDDLK